MANSLLETQNVFVHIVACIFNIVAHLLEARTVEAEKQPLLGNRQYTQQRYVTRCDVTQQ
jgi:hypothetical protein